MIQAVLLLPWVLLLPATALPAQARQGPRPALAVTRTLPNMLFKQLFLPDAEACQQLLHPAPASAPLPEFLSSLALELALEEVGCPREAHSLQRQLIRMAEKDVAETLEGQADSTEVIPGGHVRGDPMVPAGQLRRAQRSVTLPETCKSEYSWVIYESAVLLAELADKLPTTDLVKELKSTAVQVTRECTQESWERLEEVAKRVMNSHKIRTHSLSVEDQIYFVKGSLSIVFRSILDVIVKEVMQYFS